MSAEHDAQTGIFPARLVLPQERATLAQLTNLAKERAPDPAMFDTHSPVFWTAEASSNRLDSYSTFMATNTLQNFAADAKAGVAFQDGHLTDGLVRTLGQSIGARYIGPNAQGRDQGVAAVEADFYTLMGLDPAIDSFVNKAQAGLVRDVSVGFFGGWYRCTLCDRDMQDFTDWNNYCPHVPGARYPVFDKAGKPTDQRVTATAEIIDAHLAEVSGVFSGATPEASILLIKARQLADAGVLDRDIANVIQRQYRINLPGTARAFAGLTPSKEETMPTLEEQLRALATEIGVPEGTDVLAHVRTLATDSGTRIKAATAQRDGDYRAALASIGLSCEGDDTLVAIRAHGVELTALRARADEGSTYRADLIKDALAEGVRAHAGFAEETYRGLLTGAPLETIKRMRDDWRAVAAQTFPGGRQTTEEGGDGQQGARSKEPVTTAVRTMTADEAARYRVGR